MKSMLIFILSLINLSFIIAVNDYIMSNYILTHSSFSARLTYTKDNLNIWDYNIHPLSNATSVKLIKELDWFVELQCDTTWHVIINDTKTQRFQPNWTDTSYIEHTKKCRNVLSLSDFGFTVPPENSSFTFNLTLGNETYFYSDPNQFLYSDTLIVFGEILTSNNIFGFGERNTEFKLDNGRYTIWPNDTTKTYEDLKTGGYNLMGHQPIALHKTRNKLFLGFVFMNTNAQDVLIENNKIEHRTIGGIIDYYITLGKTADDAIVNIHEIIGRPIMPPLWSWGWHHCRWNYYNTEHISYVYNTYKYYKLPLDAMWADIDILGGRRNFNLNRRNFNDLPDLIQAIHDDEGKFIPIVDYGIPNSVTDPFYVMGKEMGAFIISNYTKTDWLSKTWPGESVFLDLLLESGQSIWWNGLRSFDETLNYDGIWWDLNEPGATEVFPNGKGEIKAKYENGNNIYCDIPYIPGYRPQHSDWETKAISLNAYSSWNNPKTNLFTMYNIRTLWTMNQIKTTYKYLRFGKKVRPFIISRGNVIGHGKYAFHWLGDNVSNWDYLKASISGIFNYNIFGVPMTGSDICGFHNNATDQLCARWHALGAFYPFSRNHKEYSVIDQEPWLFNNTFDVSKVAINWRYSTIRYIYSQLFSVSWGRTGSFFKPVFFEFPEEEILLNNSTVWNTHIMVGHSWLFIPNWNNATADYQGYFPNANWNKYPTGQTVVNYSHNNTDMEVRWTRKWNGNFTTINIFQRGGTIVPFQDTVTPYQIVNSFDLRYRGITLLINPNENWSANGNVIYDNDDIDVITNKNYYEIAFSYTLNNVSFKVLNNNSGIKYSYNDMQLNKIIIFRADEIWDKLGGEVGESHVILNNGISNDISVINDAESNTIVIDLENWELSWMDVVVVLF